MQLTWPHEDTEWYDLPRVLDCYVEVAQAITRYEPLLIVSRDIEECKADMTARGFDPSGLPISFVQCPLNDTWARDHGAISVHGGNGEKLVLDFVFNGQITRTIYNKGAFAKDVRYVDMRPFVLEGGSIDTDGAGTLMATSECLCSLNRNEYLSQKEIEARLCKAFGLKRILWLDHGGIIGDDTDSHVDILARFCSEDTIAYTSCEDASDPNFGPLKEMEEQLRTFRTLDGKPYNLIPLPLPDPMFLDDYRLPASYANFLVVNGAVLMPGAASAKDDIAAAQLRKAFPGRKVEIIDCRALLSGHGGLHCITMNYPDLWR